MPDDPIDDFDSFVTPPAKPKRQREFRTDRNNNPIAAAVTTGGKNQFTAALDAAEIPWEHGDPFPGNSKLSTIRIKGDPYEGARAILSNSNALKWYRGTTGKTILPKYGVRSNTDFAKLPIEHQNDIINGIYQSEGGRGLLKPSQDDFDKFVGNGQQQAAPQATPDDDFDKYVIQPEQAVASPLEGETGLKTGIAGETKLKTPKVTVGIKPVDDFPQGPEVQLLPVDFTKTTGMPRTQTPSGLLTNLLEPQQQPKGTVEEELTQSKYKTPASTELGQAAKIPFSPHLNPTQDDIVQGYLNSLGPEYAKYGEKYKSETGRNILALSPDDIDRDKEGNIYVRPTRAAVDVLNAYVKSGGDINAAKAEGARIAGERRGAVSTAEQQAAPDIAEVRAGRIGLGTQSAAQRAVGSPIMSYGGAKIAQLGGLLSGFGLAPNKASDYLKTRGKIMELGAGSAPLTPAGEEIQRSVPEKVGTGLTHLGLGIADILLLKKGTGLSTGQIMALESLAGDTDSPPAQRANNAAQAYALGRMLDGHLSRAMSAGVFAVPSAVHGAQNVARAEPGKRKDAAIDALIDVAIQGGVGAALSGGKGERPLELGIEKAPRAREGEIEYVERNTEVPESVGRVPQETPNVAERPAVGVAERAPELTSPTESASAGVAEPKLEQPESASVKAFITKADEAALKARGYTDEQIYSMKPQDAQQILATEQVSDVKTAPQEVQEGNNAPLQPAKVEPQITPAPEAVGKESPATAPPPKTAATADDAFQHLRDNGLQDIPIKPVFLGLDTSQRRPIGSTEIELTPDLKLTGGAKSFVVFPDADGKTGTAYSNPRGGSPESARQAGFADRSQGRPAKLGEGGKWIVGSETSAPPPVEGETVAKESTIKTVVEHPDGWKIEQVTVPFVSKKGVVKDLIHYRIIGPDNKPLVSGESGSLAEAQSQLNDIAPSTPPTVAAPKPDGAEPWRTTKDEYVAAGGDENEWISSFLNKLNGNWRDIPRSVLEKEAPEYARVAAGTKRAGDAHVMLTPEAVTPNAFLDSMAPMQRARAKAALDKQIRSNGQILTRAELVDRLIDEGATIEHHEVVDETARRKLQREYDRTKGTHPFGNQNHPETIRFNEVKRQLAEGPKIVTRRLVLPDGSFRDEQTLSKTAIDYAERRLAAKSVSAPEGRGAPTKVEPIATEGKTVLQQAADDAQAKLDALGPEPHKPSPEAKAFGSAGREATRAKYPEQVARWEAETKAYNTWRRKYGPLKKAQVEASNKAFYERQASEAKPVEPTAPETAPDIETRIQERIKSEIPDHAPKGIRAAKERMIRREESPVETKPLGKEAGAAKLPQEEFDRLLSRGWDFYDQKVKPTFEEWSRKIKAEFGDVTEHLRGVWNQLQGREEEGAPTTSIKNAAVESAREVRDLPDLTPADHQSWAEAGEKAREQGLDTPDKADAIARQVNDGTKRQLTAEESAGLRDRLRGIENDFEKLAKLTDAETDPEKLAALKMDADVLRERHRDLTDATKKAGTDLARALAIRRSAVDQDMLLTQLGAERSYKLSTGKEPTTEVRKQIKDLVDQNKELAAKVTEHEERIKNDQISKATEKIRREVEREKRRGVRQVKKEVLDKEVKDLTAQFAAAWKKVRGQSGVQPSVFSRLDPEGELMKIAAKIIRNRVQANLGIKAEALVDEVHGLLQDVADLDRRDIKEMITGYGRKGKPQSPLQQELNKLKSELRKGLVGEDVAEGKITEKQQGPKPDYVQREREMKVVRSRIAELQKMVESGVRTVRGKSERVPDAELAAARSERNALNKQLAEMSTAQRKAENEAAIAAGTRTATRQGPPNMPRVNAARNARLEKQITELERKIEAEDFSGKPPRQAPVYDRKGNELRAKLERVRRDFNRLKEKNQESTVLDALVRWKRFSVLGYPTTLGKLTTAASGRMIMSPLYETVGQVGKQIMPKTFAEEPGTKGFLKGEAAAVKQLWSSDSMRDFLSHLKGGEDLIELLYGKEGGDEFLKGSGGKSYIPRTVGEVMDRPGHLHAALKTVPKRAAFFRHFERALDAEVSKPNPRDIRDPLVQLEIAGEAKAYAESKRAILQHGNAVTELFNRAVQGAARSKYRLARVLGKALQFEYPITKVPANYVGEVATHIGGLPVGVGEAATRGIANRVVRPLLKTEAQTRLGKVRRSLEQKLPQAMEDLEPEDRQRIARAIKVGGVGLGFVVWGAMRPDQFGGYYQPGKRDPKDVKFGGMRFMGIDIPRWMGHIPPLEAAQFGATLRRVADSLIAKQKTKKEAFTEAGVEATKGLAEEVPFIDPMLNSAHGVGAILGKEGERRKFIGGEIRSNIPGAIQQGARLTDYAEGTSVLDRLNPFGSKESISRKPQTIGQEVKMGIPGARQTVPISPVFGSKATKASNEVQRLDLDVKGVSKKPDESPKDFEERQQRINPYIRKTIEAIVDMPKYQKETDENKTEWLKQGIDAARKEGESQEKQKPEKEKPKKEFPIPAVNFQKSSALDKVRFSDPGNSFANAFKKRLSQNSLSA